MDTFLKSCYEEENRIFLSLKGGLAELKKIQEFIIDRGGRPKHTIDIKNDSVITENKKTINTALTWKEKTKEAVRILGGSAQPKDIIAFIKSDEPNTNEQTVRNNVYNCLSFGVKNEIYKKETRGNLNEPVYSLIE